MRSRALLLVALGGLSGCIDADGEQPWALGETRTRLVDANAVPRGRNVNDFRIYVPLGVDRKTFALVARDSLVIGEGARILDEKGSILEAGFASVASAGTTQIDIGVRVGSVYSYGESPLLSEGVLVQGYLRTAKTPRLSQSASVSVGVLQGMSSDIEEFRWSLRAPSPGPQPIPTSRLVTLPPGAYGSTSISPLSTALLRAGHYHFDSLMLEEGGVLRIDNTAGPVYVWVRNQLVLSGFIEEYYLGANVFIGYSGVSSPIIKSSLNVTLVAPSAELVVPNTEQPHRGAFFARSIRVEPGATIRRGAFSTIEAVSPDQVCHGCATVAEQVARRCCDTFQRARGTIRERVSSCKALCTVSEMVAPCAAECASISAEDETRAQLRFEECQSEIALSHATCQLRYAYRASACASLGYPGDEGVRCTL